MKVLETLSRFNTNDLNSALEFNEELLNTSSAMRFEIPQINLEPDQVGDILL
jgi:hypothetical protein